MKNIKLIIVIILLLSLTGCIKEYKVTEEESDSVAEYMAGILLENDDDYEQDLTPIEDILGDDTANEEGTATPSPTVEPIDENNDTENANTENANTENTNTENANTQKDYTLADIIGVKNFDIEYAGYEFAEMYPEEVDDTYFSLDARDGYQLLIISFEVKNKSKGNKTLNLKDSDIKYQLDLNTGIVDKPQFLPLINDLQFADISIKGGKSEELLLVFEVSKKTDSSNMKLIVSKNEISKTIEIK